MTDNMSVFCKRNCHKYNNKLANLPFDLFTIIVGLTWPHQNAFLSTTSESFELPQSFQIIHEKISKKAKCTT